MSFCPGHNDAVVIPLPLTHAEAGFLADFCSMCPFQTSLCWSTSLTFLHIPGVYLSPHVSRRHFSLDLWLMCKEEERWQPGSMVEPRSTQHPSWRISCLALSVSSGASAEGAAHSWASAGDVAVRKNRERSFPVVQQAYPLENTYVGLQSGMRDVLCS